MGGCQTKQSKEVERRASSDVAPKQRERRVVLPEHVEVDLYCPEASSQEEVKKSEESRRIILKALEASVVFSGLEQEQKEGIVRSMEALEVPAQNLLIKQGDPGDAFYVVESGRFDILVDGERVAESSRGGSFGELALIMNQPRAASVLATEASLCWKIDRKPFRYFLASSSNTSLDEIFTDLKTVKILQGLPAAHLYKLAAHVSKEKFGAGSVIIKKGETGDKFYMLKKGVVECRRIGAEDARVELLAGSHFGERALTHRQPRACDVVAKTAAECITLSKSDFEALLGSASDAMDRQHVVNVVRASRSNRNLHPDKVYENLEKGFLGANETLPASEDHFIAVTKGRLILDRPAGIIRAVDEGESYDGPWSKGTAETDVEFYKLRKREAELSTTDFHQHTPEFFDSLDVGRTLGTGTFGRVKLATRGDETYALKLLVKQAMVDLNQAESVELERRILFKLRGHPFVLHCHATFQSKDVCFFVLEFVQGGELFSRVEGGVHEDEALFHSACVIDALDHIHAKAIVYRDLKPENVLIDNRGFARIVDFGFAKVLQKKTYTILGTPEYLSPECVLGKGYGFDVDLWAFGVLVYETLAGRSPFYASNPDDTMTVFRLIVAAKIKFPPKKHPTPLTQAFVTGLLARDLKERLGARHGAPSIKAHAFFSPIDFDNLRAKKLTPPYVPNLKTATDASLFDAYPEDMALKPYEGDNKIFSDFGPKVRFSSS
ncbi:hypothetical protein CTAYLR_001671 [Chrysophaeum taylorii]|uniref:cGMP-dependent protein kinase n=1 Tax=Chrysophaeum taylorii TaxID=2483200 RepID=A0AAD7UEE8_9STRA|nr:hypothetical protein CTAYLR_001671 [Chrysophaeum taylorii]